MFGKRIEGLIFQVVGEQSSALEDKLMGVVGRLGIVWSPGIGKCAMLHILFDK